jgi:GMP synthase (glutamine-hydrolysing)
MLDQATTTASPTQPGKSHDNVPLKPILIILHQENSIPAHVGRTLQGMGHRLDIRRPRFGDPLPATMQEHDGAVIFGGPQSANDDEDFIKTEIDWISVPLAENKPFLGICLGAQMFARLLGARVYLYPQERCGIGYHPVEPLVPAIGDVPWPTTVYQWHREGFDLPTGAELIDRPRGHGLPQPGLQIRLRNRHSVPSGNHLSSGLPLVRKQPASPSIALRPG